MEPPEALLAHEAWLLAPTPRRSGDTPTWAEVAITSARRHGSGLVACLNGCGDRDAAQMRTGYVVGLPRDVLPSPEKDEYYWTDLMGCRVFDGDGEEFGTVKELFETGANDVMVVTGDRERLVPFVLGHTVLEVHLEARRIVVDWDMNWDMNWDKDGDNSL